MYCYFYNYYGFHNFYYIEENEPTDISFAPHTPKIKGCDKNNLSAKITNNWLNKSERFEPPTFQETIKYVFLKTTKHIYHWHLDW